MYNNIPTKVLTGEVRLSYVNLVAPRVNNNDPTATPKYSVTLLIPHRGCCQGRTGEDLGWRPSSGPAYPHPRRRWRS